MCQSSTWCTGIMDIYIIRGNYDRETLSLMLVAKILLIYWAVGSTSRDGIEEMDCGGESLN